MESSTIMEEEQVPQETTAATVSVAYPPSHYGGFPGAGFPMGLAKPIRPTPILPVPPSSKMASLNLKEKASPTNLIEPLPLSLNLPPPTPRSQDHSPASSDHSSPSSSSSAFQAISAGKFGGGGDSIISVA